MAALEEVLVVVIILISSHFVSGRMMTGDCLLMTRTQRTAEVRNWANCWKSWINYSRRHQSNALSTPNAGFPSLTRQEVSDSACA